MTEKRRIVNMHTAPIRALIAEDDALVASVIAAELDKIGVQVAGQASDGLQAVEMAGSLKPDVVLMDIEMPEMNGLEAARRIQSLCPTPVVVLTVYEEQEMADQAAEAGVGAYLLKPPKAHELERAITIARARFADLIEMRRLNTQLQEALAKVKTLHGLLPICSNCKKIRDDQGYWQQIEMYIRNHSDAEFSHGICPECTIKLYPPDQFPSLYKKNE
jgi:AmiR/NasT family two-component response regulator